MHKIMSHINFTSLRKLSLWIIARTIIFTIAWCGFAYASTWAMMVVGDDITGPIWYKASLILLYPYASLWVVIEVIMALRKITHVTKWKILLLYFFIQFLYSPFAVMLLIQASRWIS